MYRQVSSVRFLGPGQLLMPSALLQPSKPMLLLISALFSHLGRITSMSFCILLRFRPPSAAPAAVAAAGCLGCGAGGGLSLEEATMASLRLASPRRPRLKMEGETHLQLFAPLFSQRPQKSVLRASLPIAFACLSISDSERAIAHNASRSGG